MNSIKKFDEDLQECADKDGEQSEQQRPASDVHNSTLQELGFGPDEEDDLQSIFSSIYSIVDAEVKEGRNAQSKMHFLSIHPRK